MRYHPRNVHSQCAACNTWQGGNGAAYALRFLDRYGESEFRRLEGLCRRERVWKAHDMADLLDALNRSGADFELLHAQRYEG